ncbi:MAG TPA: iron-containing alcohol dehydrogenase, partial [Tetragenococcus sp.]|nr:iron-containing alcohol dehydrogenase [Tetragenococcus sp.]
GAHSIHDALTTLADSHKVLHGKKVAYGILVQLMIEGKVDEIKRLKDFYQLLALPGTLKEMDLELSESDYQKVGQRAALPNEQIHFLPQKITADIVIQAMKKLEKLA